MFQLNICLKPWCLITAFIRLGVLITTLSHGCWVTLCQSWHQNFKQLGSIWWLVTIIWFNWSHFRGYHWGPGLETTKFPSGCDVCEWRSTRNTRSRPHHGQPNLQTSTPLKTFGIWWRGLISGHKPPNRAEQLDIWHQEQHKVTKQQCERVVESISKNTLKLRLKICFIPPNIFILFIYIYIFIYFFFYSQLSCVLAHSPQVFHFTVGWPFASTGGKIQFGCFWLLIFLFIKFQSFWWNSDLEIGLPMMGSWSRGPSSTPWLTKLCDMEHCPAGKLVLRVWGTLSEDGLICGLILAKLLSFSQDLVV